MRANNFETARFNMIEQQIRPCEVIDEKVLSTIRTVPREQFISEAYQQFAFTDTHIPLDNQRVMMKPVQEGVMLQALAIKPEDRILEIGTGSGFITACLANMGKTVISYEIDAELSEQAKKCLQSQEIKNVRLIVGDCFEAALPQRSFDVIAVTGSVPDHVNMLEDLLAPGGRMFLIKGQTPIMCATLFTRDQGGDLHEDKLCETQIPPLQNTPQPEQFVF